ncbi:MAG: phosphatase [Pyramidobacter sp.]|jgi:putative hydrolase
MKKFLFDLHTHTVSSGHAFSTLKENIEEAARKGLMAIGSSDHSCGMEGAPTSKFFGNYRVVTPTVMGVRVFMGVEANVVDYDGSLDMEEKLLKKMDYVIASLHTSNIQSGSREENTAALIGAMRNPFVKIIGHPDDDRYPLDYPRLVRAAAEYHVALEVNSASPAGKTGRLNAAANIPVFLALCRQYGVPVIAGSDAHIWYDVGNLTEARRILEDVHFPEELILNVDMARLSQVLNNSPRLTSDAGD